MMYMGREEMLKFLKVFAYEVEGMFNDNIDEVEWPEVEDRLRGIRDEVYNSIMDLAEEVEE